MQDGNNSGVGRGGARPGAGRKPSANPKSVMVSFMLTALAAGNLLRAAEAQGLSRNEYMNALLEDLPCEVG